MGDTLIKDLIDRCSYDEIYLTEQQLANATAHVPAGVYQDMFEKLPMKQKDQMEKQWGKAPGIAYVHENEIALSGLEFGNVFVALQPPRGYGMYPDSFLNDLPLIYPFIINDPGEGTQSKRRAHAVIIDHMTPPMTTADGYGEIAQLMQLVDEYYQVESLDPTKLPLIQRQIWELIQEINLGDDLAFLLNHDHDHEHDKEIEKQHEHCHEHIGLDKNEHHNNAKNEHNHQHSHEHNHNEIIDENEDHDDDNPNHHKKNKNKEGHVHHEHSHEHNNSNHIIHDNENRHEHSNDHHENEDEIEQHQHEHSNDHRENKDENEHHYEHSPPHHKEN